MKFILLLNLLAPPAMASMASDFVSNENPALSTATKGNEKNTVGLRGRDRNLARRANKGPRTKIPKFRGGPPASEEEVDDEKEEENDVSISTATIAPPAKFSRNQPKTTSPRRNKPDKNKMRPNNGRGGSRPSKYEAEDPSVDEEEEKSPATTTTTTAATAPVGREWKKTKEKKHSHVKKDHPKKDVAKKRNKGSPQKGSNLQNQITNNVESSFAMTQMKGKVKAEKPPKAPKDEDVKDKDAEDKDDKRFGRGDKKDKPEKADKRDKPERTRKQDDKRVGGKGGGSPTTDSSSADVGGGWMPTPAPVATSTSFATPTLPPSPKPTTAQPVEVEVEVQVEEASPEPTPAPTTEEPTTAPPVVAVQEVELEVEEVDESLKPTYYPSLFPTLAPTIEPEVSSTEPLPRCPPAYDRERTDYVAGDTVQMSRYIWECLPGEYEEYCNVPDKDDNWDDETYNVWFYAWDRQGPCEVVHYDAGDILSMINEEATDVSMVAPATTEEDLAEEEEEASPSTEMPDCPPVYDPSQTYSAGSLVEVHQQTFQCRDELHEPWCNEPNWSAEFEKRDANAEELWHSAWMYLGPCAPVTLGEVMDMVALVEEIGGDV